MFIPFVIIAAIVLAAVVAFGIVRWQQPSGKIMAVSGGLFLIALAAFTALVLFLAGSAQHGVPL